MQTSRPPTGRRRRRKTRRSRIDNTGVRGGRCRPLKADSIVPSLLSRHLRAGLSRCRRYAAGEWFIPLTGTIIEFRDRLALAAFGDAPQNSRHNFVVRSAESILSAAKAVVFLTVFRLD